jgi:hypothetical protein
MGYRFVRIKNTLYWLDIMNTLLYKQGSKTQASALQAHT